MSMPVLPASPVEDTLLTAEQKKQIEERFEGVYVLEFIFSFGRRLGLFLTVSHRIRFNPCKEIWLFIASSDHIALNCRPIVDGLTSTIDRSCRLF